MVFILTSIVSADEASNICLISERHRVFFFHVFNCIHICNVFTCESMFGMGVTGSEMIAFMLGKNASCLVW